MGESDHDELNNTIFQLRKELHEAHEELARSNNELMQLTLELDDRVEQRTAELQTLQKELRAHRDNLQDMVEDQSREITETNKQLREKIGELESSEQRFLSILESDEENFCICDISTYELLYTNYFSRDKLSEALGEKCFQAIHGLDRPCPVCAEDAIANGCEPRVLEHRDNSTGQWYRYINKRINWPDGRTARFVRTFDITDIKSAQEILLRSMVSRELVGEIIQHLKEKYSLRSGQLFGLGRDMALKTNAQSISEYLDQFTSMGFGDIRLEQHVIDKNWWIFNGNDLVEVKGDSISPTDKFTLGYLCGSIEKITGAERALGIEFECQSMGDRQCRFIIRGN